METEAKELTVIPTGGSLSGFAVTTATPVGKQPSARRNAWVSNAELAVVFIV